jgi:type II secretory pathway component PulJ
MAAVMLAPQHGQSLAQCMVGMMLSLLVVMAAFSAFAWIQRSQALLQQQMDMYQMLHQATAKLRERAMRAGAPELWIEEPHKLVWNSLPNKVAGDDKSVQLMQWRSLTPTDCQGHEASLLSWIADDFRRNSTRGLVCKDAARTSSQYQTLIEHTDEVRFLYAQGLGSRLTDAFNQPMQWLSASQVTDWNAVRAVHLCLHVRGAGVNATPAGVSCYTSKPLVHGAMAWRSVLHLTHASP